MKNSTRGKRAAALLACILLLACGASGQEAARQPAPDAPRSEADATLTNTAVVKLVRAKFSEKTIIAIIRARPARFDLSPDRLVELKKAGVPERVILAMLAREESDLLASAGGSPALDDDFENDPFFGGADGARRGGASRPKGGTQPGNEAGETNIFGSSGGARGRVKSNGVGGGAEGESQMVGSASVRIVRPPAEAGAGPPKLERTPTLTNDAVAELVAAGFSEGTIIRRIEQSPADFDLSPQKLADLRRRRVTEPIIAAMRAAMSDGETMK